MNSTYNTAVTALTPSSTTTTGNNNNNSINNGLAFKNSFKNDLSLKLHHLLANIRTFPDTGTAI